MAGSTTKEKPTLSKMTHGLSLNVKLTILQSCHKGDNTGIQKAAIKIKAQ
jgi:hypothetical protein